MQSTASKRWNSGEINPIVVADDSHYVRAARAGDLMVALTLDDHGSICNCNLACEALFMYPRSELVWRPVSMLLPQLAGLELMQNGQPDSRLRFLSRIGRHFPAVTKNGDLFACYLYFNLLNHTGNSGITLIVRPAEEAIGESRSRLHEDKGMTS